jgi:alkane 1-monooxygenase
MMRMAPFVLVFLPVLTAAAGLALGGAWTWATFGLIFGLVPLLDHALGESRHNPEPGDTSRLAYWGYRLVTWLVAPALIGLTLVAAWSVSHLAWAPWELAGLLVSVGVVSGGLGITAAHELIHKTATFERLLGQALLWNACYMHFYIEHLIGHHSRVATPEDPASARYGETLWAFLPRTVVGSWRSAWGLEVARLARAGHGAWSLRNRMLAYAALPLAGAGLLALAWGPAAGAFFLGQGVLAFLLLEAVNYVEHYGLERRPLPSGRFERVTDSHSWASGLRLSNWLTFQLQRHADHHTHPARRYEELRFSPESPVLPTGYPGMIWLALVPPLWRRVMHPRVEATRVRVGGPEA